MKFFGVRAFAKWAKHFGVTVAVALVAWSTQAVPIAITYTDPPGTGFYDPTPRIPVGGNPGTTLGEQRRNVLEAVASRFGELLEGSQPITIRARFALQSSNILAAATPIGFTFNFVGAPVHGVAYPNALGNQLAGGDLDPATDDILVNCNSGYDTGAFGGSYGAWYYGLDGEPATAGDYDFYGVMLHEMSHGLGFISWLQPDGTYRNNRATIYDDFLLNVISQRVIDLTEAERASAVVSSNLFFYGPHVAARNANVAPRLYAPATWENGSSVSHFDEATFSFPGSANELQTPVVSAPTHNLGPLLPAVFEDLGWTFFDHDPGTAGSVTITQPAPNGRVSDLIVRGTAADWLNNSTNGAIGVNAIHLVFSRNTDGKFWNWNTAAFDSTTFTPADHSVDAAATLVPINTGTVEWQRSLPVNVPDGGYSVQVSMLDSFANESTYSAVSFSKDTVAPAVSLSPLTDGQSVFNFNQIGGALSESAGVTFKIERLSDSQYWNGSAWIANPLDEAVVVSATVTNNNWSAPIASLPNRAQTTPGGYRFFVRAIDLAGNGTNFQFTLFRSPADATPPQGTLVSITPGQVFTNNTLPSLHGAASDPESGIGLVQVYLMRATNPGFVYWTGSSWSATPTALAASYDANIDTWTLTAPLPTGANLINADYQAQVSVYNQESPPGAETFTVPFTVDYHPMFVWTQGSYTDAIIGNENLNWDNPANWDLGSVPTPDAKVVVTYGGADSRSLSDLSVYELIVGNASLTASNLSVKKLTFSSGQISSPHLTLVANGTFNWIGGTLTGNYDIQTNATLRLIGSGNSSLAPDVTLNNYGRILWTNDFAFNGAGGGTLNNYGLFEIQGDGQFFNYTGGATLRFNNFGTLRKTAGTNTVFSLANNGWRLNQAGVLDLQAGGLTLQSQANFQNGSEVMGGGWLRLDSSIMTLAGNSVVQSNTTIELNTASLAGFGSLSGPGLLRWGAGSFTGTNLIACQLLLPGSSDRMVSGRLTYAGPNATWTGTGQLNMVAGAAFTNSGCFTAQSDAIVFNITGGVVLPRFVNAGTFKKAGTTNATLFSLANGGVAFDNAGSVLVESGTLSLNGGGSHAHGDFAAGVDAKIEFGGGTHNVIAPVTFSGGGRSRIVGGTVVFSNTTNIVDVGGTLELANAGTLAGSGGLQGAGTFDWTGGNLAGELSLAANFASTISGGNDKALAGGTLYNAGTITWTGSGNISTYSGSRLDNAGLFHIQNGATLFNLTGGLPAPIFYNSGTIRKTGVTNDTIIRVDNGGLMVTNVGVIDVQTGALISRGQLTLNPGGTVSGAGFLREEQGVITMNGSTVLAGGNVQLVGNATVKGTGTWTGPGTFWLTSGNVDGDLAIGPQAGLMLNGSSGCQVLRNLTNNGTAHWTGAGDLYFSAVGRFVNNGTFIAQNSAQLINITGGGVAEFFNNGTFRKVSSGTTTFSLANSGVFLHHNGTLDLQAGVLAINGGHVNGPASQMRVTLGGLNPGAQYGQCSIQGSTTFNGTLVLVLTNGFTPASGNSFTLASYNAFTGSFATSQLPPLPAGLQWRLNYGPNSLNAEIATATTFQNLGLINGQFQFNLTGAPGSQCLIEASTNLSAWTPLLTNIPFNGNLNFTDPQTTQFSRRFYRATIFP